jgi:putative hydrolase of the HAD superfamily
MLILFDIDDTLLDHDAASRSAATFLHADIGSSVAIEEFLTRWADALERHFARYLAGEISHAEQRRERLRELVDPTLTAEAADRIFAGYLARYEAGWMLFPDVLPCLNGLAEYRLGVISNGEGLQQRRKLVATGIADRFACIAIADECGCAKPDPAIFRRACAMLGESPSTSVYIGDRYDVDAQAARAAGLQGIWLDRRGKATQEHLPTIIESLDRLPALLCQT